MRLATLSMLLCIILVTSCSNGGSEGGSAGYSPVLPTSYYKVSGVYCEAYTTCGVNQEILQNSVTWLDSMAPQIQGLLGNCGYVTIVFDGCDTGYYDGMIHVSSDIGPLHRRLAHEYATHISCSNGYIESGYMPEVISEGIEYLLGFENKPTTCSYDIEVIDYTTQLHFACWLIDHYGTDIFYRIVHKQFIITEDILTQWRGY